MQKIKFRSSSGTIEITDGNLSSIGGESKKILSLDDIDPNSQKSVVQSVKCIDMPGQRFVSSVPDVKTIMLKLSFAPVYLAEGLFRTSEAEMYALRREVLKYFPLGETGTLEYTNANGTYEISARLDEIPSVVCRDGYLCECTLYLTCDYPYWSHTVTSETYSAPSTIVPTEYGDIPSPISGIITCTASMSEMGEDWVTYFRVKETGSVFHTIDFCKPLATGEVLTFSLGFNNEFKILYGNGADASEYVFFSQYSEPCLSRPPSGTISFELYAGGSANIQISFHNLFTIV